MLLRERLELTLQIAHRLRGRLRRYDVLGRWGGEEFIVLTPAVPDDETLRRLADQLEAMAEEVEGKTGSTEPR